MSTVPAVRLTLAAAIILQSWLDQPEAKWNRFENYYPGDNYCDWVALSAYGPLTRRTSRGRARRVGR